MHDATLSDIGETGAIRRLCGRLHAGRGVRTGAGLDDCAVIDPARLFRTGRRGNLSSSCPHDLLLTSDPVIESVHFDQRTSPPLIGRKALARTLSDIAAMGGTPLWALVDIVAPASTPIKRMNGIYAGISALAKRNGMSIVGGDLSRGQALELHVFCIGRVPKGKAVLRSGARPKQGLFVTGRLGGSSAGKHLRFQPRLAEGKWLAANNWASAMIDISDGLASDLRRINGQSGTGAELMLDSIPVSRRLTSCMDRRAAIMKALSDGEDFELLFTVPAARIQKFRAAWGRKFRLRCTLIGAMTARKGRIECIEREGARTVLNGTGYEHF